MCSSSACKLPLAYEAEFIAQNIFSAQRFSNQFVMFLFCESEENFIIFVFQSSFVAKQCILSQLVNSLLLRGGLGLIHEKCSGLEALITLARRSTRERSFWKWEQSIRNPLLKTKDFSGASSSANNSFITYGIAIHQAFIIATKSLCFWQNVFQ